jgi:hypothetical protein
MDRGVEGRDEKGDVCRPRGDDGGPSYCCIVGRSWDLNAVGWDEDAFVGGTQDEDVPLSIFFPVRFPVIGC